MKSCLSSIDDKVQVLIDKFKSNELTFSQLVDSFNVLPDNGDLSRFLRNKELFKELIEGNVLNKNDLKYLLNKIDNEYEADALCNNEFLFNALDSSLFQELIDTFKIKNALDKLLRDRDLFNEMIENNKLTRKVLGHLFDKIDQPTEINWLCGNVPLIKVFLNEFALTKDLVDRVYRLMEENRDGIVEEFDLHTIFDLIEFHQTHTFDWSSGGWCNKTEEDAIPPDQEILKLNELNRYTYTFDLNENQRLELAEILKDSEVSQNRLIQIVDNNLQDQYDFESLKNLLTKDNDKKLKTRFNF